MFRNGFTKPRVAARELLNRNLSTLTVLQGAVLLAILNALAFYFLFDAMVRFSPEPIEITTPPLLVSVFEQMIFIILYSFVISQLSGLFKHKVSFEQSATIFVWFNILQICATVAALLALLILGPFGLLIVFLPLIWTLWAMGHYWAELIEHERAIMGFILVLAGLFISFPILTVIVKLLNLPGTDIITDV